MKHLQLLLSLLLLTISLPTFAQTKHDVNPVYIANLLTNSISTDEMRETCRFYQLTESTGEEGYTVFTDHHGNAIRFKDTGNPDVGVNGRLIELQTKDNAKTIERILCQVGYRKQADAYERGSRITAITRCQLTTKGSHRLLSFLKINPQTISR